MRKPREMKEPCNSTFCEKAQPDIVPILLKPLVKTFLTPFGKCREIIKKLYVQSLVECSQRQRITVENSKRSITKHYFLKHYTNQIQVCRQMFLSTLGLSEKMIRLWVCSGSFHSIQIVSEETRG